MNYVASVEDGLHEVISVATKALEDFEGVLVRMDDPVPVSRRRLTWRAAVKKRVVIGAVGLYFALSLVSTRVPGPTHWFGPGRALAADVGLVERSDAAVDTFLTYHAPSPIRRIGSLPVAPHVQPQPATGLSRRLGPNSRAAIRHVKHALGQQ